MISDAETAGDNADELATVIVSLSKFQTATQILTNAYQNAVETQEKLWQEIEQRQDFSALYADRKQAREDYLRRYFTHD